MFWSKAFIVTSKEIPQEAETVGQRLMLRAGFVRMLSGGIYSYLPLGLRVLYNIQRIIREELNARSASELLLPALQPLELWIKSGRDKDMGEVMIRFVDRRGRKMCLGPTHEEVITDLVKDHVFSYKQLPLILYQIQTKFRDEIRPRFGLIRACEFIMKDAYSFDRDAQGLDKSYEAMLGAYNQIFKRCGLAFLTVKADPGVMGGDVSHEFMVPAESGEDIVWRCPNCNSLTSLGEEKEKRCPHCNEKLEKINAIEVGHIFKLGTKYSSALGANFLDAQGKLKPIIMGCYGIGVSRLLPTIIEQHHDADGIIWPKEVSPFQAIVLPLDISDEKIMGLASDIYSILQQNGLEVLFDDRDERAGVKFKDADLIGIPLSIVIGQKNLSSHKVEIKIRQDKQTFLVDKKELLPKIKEILKRMV